MQNTVLMAVRIKNSLKANFQNFEKFGKNTRTCIFAQPMWGIPYNLFIPYASIYMIALGLTSRDIGFVTAVGFIFQMIFAIVGGFVTDRLGRRVTLFVFDIIAWSLPTFIWTFAQDFNYFMAAAILNGAVRASYTSWACILVEDSKMEDRVSIFSWLAVADILSGFFAPLAGWLIMKFTLVPAIRGLYFFAFISMTAMIFIRRYFTLETAVGVIKKEEAKKHSIWEEIREYKIALGLLVANPAALVAFYLIFFNNLHIQLRNVFLGIILNEGNGIPKEAIAIFPAVNALIVFIFTIFVIPLLGKKSSTMPLFFGFLSLIASYGFLFFPQDGTFFSVMISTIVGAVGMAILPPFINSDLANCINPNYRAKTMAIVLAGTFGGSAPFSYFTGYLSELNPKYPAMFFIVMCITGIASLFMLTYFKRKNSIL